MVGRYRGFLAFAKKQSPLVQTVHCVIHRQHLVAKNLTEELHEALQIQIKVINKIKSSALNSRLFAILCEENNEQFNQLLLHTEVRWLSKGNCLQRLVKLYNSAMEFLSEHYQSLAKKFFQNKCHLADLFMKFNEEQKKLQGKDITFI